MTHEHQPPATEPVDFLTQQFWDERYASSDAVWSGKPNLRLVESATDLAAGAALDIGCGEGADAIWLASRGWTVTATDLSPVALERAVQLAEAADDAVAQRITWQQVDLLQWEPPTESFDLVTAQFMQLPPQYLRPLRKRLAAAVRPGGTLLLVGHQLPEPEMLKDFAGPPDMFFTADEVVAELDPHEWTITTAGDFSRPDSHHADAHGHAVDVVVAAVKR